MGELNTHVKVIHCDEELRKCDVCFKTFKSEKYMLKHKQHVHENIKVATCEICAKTFKFMSSLKYHMNAFHTAEEDKIKPNHCCSYCGKVLSTITQLKNHIQKQHENPGGQEKSFACGYPGCDKAFYEKGALVRHVARVHEKTSQVTCEVCNMVLCDKQGLRNHKLSFHAEELGLVKPDKPKVVRERKFPCDKCDFAFTLPSLLKYHIKHVHDKIKDFHCEQCSLSFHQKSGLKKHIETVHEKLKPFLCMVCERGFAMRSTLTYHLKAKHGIDNPDVPERRIIFNKKKRKQDLINPPFESY